MSIPARAIPAVRDFSWLDGETPRGRASRRRWTVACALLLVLLGVALLYSVAGTGSETGPQPVGVRQWSSP